MPQITHDELRKQIEAMELSREIICQKNGPFSPTLAKLDAALSRARELMRESPIAAEVRALYPDAPDTEPNTTREALEDGVAELSHELWKMSETEIGMAHDLDEFKKATRLALEAIKALDDLVARPERHNVGEILRELKFAADLARKALGEMEKK